MPEENLLDLADGVDDVTAAALGNTGLAAWLALTWRANLQPGEAVLVLGATGALGSVAVQIAKALGASLVVAADRNPDRLARAAAHGADATVTITPDVDLVDAFRQAAGGRGFDVIIDPLWGEPALAAMHAAAQRARHIQIGQSAGATIELPAHLVRGARLEILGFAHIDPPGADPPRGLPEAHRTGRHRRPARRHAGPATLRLRQGMGTATAGCTGQTRPHPTVRVVEPVRAVRRSFRRRHSRPISRNVANQARPRPVVRSMAGVNSIGRVRARSSWVGARHSSPAPVAAANRRRRRFRRSRHPALSGGRCTYRTAAGGGEHGRAPRARPRPRPLEG